MPQAGKQKILMFTDWYEPGFKAGGPIQACKNVVAVLKERYDFFIFCSDRDLGDKSPYDGIPLNQWIKAEDGVNIWYASSELVTNGNLSKLVHKIRPDYVYFNSMYSFKFTLLPLWVLVNNHFPGKIILAPRGMLHKGALRKKYLKKNIFLKLFLIIGWSKRIIFQATDEQEEKDLKHFFTSKVNIMVVEDIPTAYGKKWEEKEKKPGYLKCVFLSRIHPKKNLHFFLERLKEIDHDVEISLDIYGSEDHLGYAEQCKKIAETLPGNIQVKFKGALLFNKVFETLRQYHLFILPTLGENYGHAIYEALSTGVPVLISDQTPWRDLEALKAGWDIPLQKTDEFKKAITTAAAWSQQEYDEWSGHAYSFAKKYMEELGAFAKYTRLFSQSEKKTILMFTDWYEPGYKAGGPIQSCKNIVNMLKGRYEFFIICSDRDLGDKTPYKNVPINQWIKSGPDTSIWYASPEFITRSNISLILNSVHPDYVYFNSMYSIKYTLLPLWILLGKHYGGRIILAPRGMLHKGALKRKYFKKYVFLKLFKLISWHKKLVFHATDDQERQDIIFFFSEEAEIIVAANIPSFTSVEWQAKQKAPGELNCVFISRIHPKKNLYYFLKVLAEIDNNLKLAFDIYGVEEDKGYANVCKELNDTLQSNISVGFKGPIPHSKVLQTIRDYHVFVLPTQGENFGHAIYEALSAGDPVLISDQTPWRNLEKVKAGWDIPLKKRDKFKAAIIQAASWNQEEYNEWSHAAFLLAKQSIDINKLFDKYMELFE